MLLSPSNIVVFDDSMKIFNNSTNKFIVMEVVLIYRCTIMNKSTRIKIKSVVLGILTKKLAEGGPKAEYKPFFVAIFNKKLITYASVIQSFYTAFGMSIYEQTAKTLAENMGFQATRQYVLKGEIDSVTDELILKIQQDLITGRLKPNSIEEMKLIKRTIKHATKPRKQPYSIVDLYLKSPEGKEYFFGITTVKPNKEGLEAHKLKLLRWMALRLSTDKNANFSVAIVVPYNPYYPKRYVRFGSDMLFDENQLLVQEAFWDLIGGKGAFQELLKIFREVGKELKPKIDAL